MNSKSLSVLVILTPFLMAACSTQQAPTTPNAPSTFETKESPITQPSSKNISTDSDPASINPTDIHPIAYIKTIEKTAQGYQLEVESTLMAQGDTAEAMALQETGCPKARLFDGDCAPSLNNNFYISKNRTPKTLTANDQTQVILLISGSDGMVPQEATFEKLYNLFHQTDAFDPIIPFRINEKDGVATQIEEQYLP